MMNSKIIQFEVKQIDENDWKMISEATALGFLHDNFCKITPIIAKMLNGKEITIPKGILRIKKYR